VRSRAAPRRREQQQQQQQHLIAAGLPLDVTGKPIPYWLWKLHGLGVEYQCEICGNYSYWGHYAFEKHFQEWRHQHALKILGIPNHKAFNNVTTIKEAIARMSLPSLPILCAFFFRLDFRQFSLLHCAYDWQYTRR
jgi:hypothetical protein